MLYLIFGIFLLIGALAASLYLYWISKKEQVHALVVNSELVMERNGEQIEFLQVLHELEIVEGDETKRLKTDCISVQELNGASLTLYWDDEKKEIVQPDILRYLPYIAGFVVAGLICLVAFFSDGFSGFSNMTAKEMLSALLVVIAVVALSNLHVIINPFVTRTKGCYEGMLKSEDGRYDTEIYSLWHGEHRQYAKREKGMSVKRKPGDPVQLFYHTRKGIVYRTEEIVLSAILSVVAFITMLILLIL